MNLKSFCLILTFFFWMLLSALFHPVNVQVPVLGNIHTIIRRWPNRWVDVAISPTFSPTERFNIKRTIRHLNLFSAVRFYFFDPELPHQKTFYLNITNVIRNGCGTSALGFTGRPVIMNLDAHCLVFNSDGFYGILKHELGHVCGFCHPQSQPDRDTWMKINVSNIRDDCLFQFWRFTSNTVVNMAVDKFEYGSIMSYPQFACAQDPKILVILPTGDDQSEYWRMGQRDGFTPLDWLKLFRAYYSNTTDKRDCSIDGANQDEGRVRIELGAYHTAKSCPKHTVLVGSHGQFCTITGFPTGHPAVCLDKSPELAYTNFEDWTSLFQVFRNPRNYTWEMKTAKVFPSSWMTGDYTYYKLNRQVLMLNVANESARSETLRTHWWPLAGSSDFCIEFAAFFSYNPAHQFNLLLIAEVQHPNKEPNEDKTVGIISNEPRKWRFHSFTLSFRRNYTEGSKVAFGWVVSSKGNITTHQWLALDNVRVHRNGVCANNTVWTNVD